MTILFHRLEINDNFFSYYCSRVSVWTKTFHCNNPLKYFQDE